MTQIQTKAVWRWWDHLSLFSVRWSFVEMGSAFSLGRTSHPYLTRLSHWSAGCEGACRCAETHNLIIQASAVLAWQDLWVLNDPPQRAWHARWRCANRNNIPGSVSEFSHSVPVKKLQSLRLSLWFPSWPSHPLQYLLSLTAKPRFDILNTNAIRLTPPVPCVSEPLPGYAARHGELATGGPPTLWV